MTAAVASATRSSCLRLRDGRWKPLSADSHTVLALHCTCFGLDLDNIKCGGFVLFCLFGVLGLGFVLFFVFVFSRGFF